MNQNGLQVSESFCNTDMKPSTTKKCKNIPCEYIVITVDASQVNLSIYNQVFYIDACKLVISSVILGVAMVTDYMFLASTSLWSLGSKIKRVVNETEKEF